MCKDQTLHQQDNNCDDQRDHSDEKDQELLGEVFIPEICLLVMEMIGGKEALKMRQISKAWLEASEHFHAIKLEFTYDISNFFKITEHVLMEHVSELVMLDNKFTVDRFKRFVKNPHLKHLQVLYLECEESMGGLFGDDDDQEFKLGDNVALFANCENFSNLEKLTIINHDLGNTGLSDIFNSPVLKKLKALHLDRNCFSNFGTSSLGTDTLKQLEELTCGWNDYSYDIQLVCKNQLFSNLKKLTVEFSLPEEDLFSIMANPVWSNLKELYLATSVKKNISSLACTLKLEKLSILVSDFDACKSLIANKSITQSLKYLDVGVIREHSSTDIDKIGSQFETFIFTVVGDDEDDNEHYAFDLFGEE